jgi:serine/threonine-protein kinase
MLGELVGSYRVQKKLGEGGMGVVYIAEHPLLHKKAVVKFLHAELSSNPQIVERFFNEARSATLIRHSGIVDVFDFGHHASGCAFILMEFLDGESVADRLRKGPLSPAVAILLARQIAGALGAAHEQRIVHRDLKPDNVFLVLDSEAAGGGRVKVLDFGIAKLAGESAGAVKTQTGAVMGTPTYMAPEQCRSAGQVDQRADIYALGCILFEMVCGRPPFVTQSLGQLIAAHMFEAPPAPASIVPSVPVDLETVILRALSKDENERQQSMAELSAQLAACVASGATAIWEGVTKPRGVKAERSAAEVSLQQTELKAATVAPGAVDPNLNATTLPPASSTTDGPLHRTTLGGSTGQLGVAVERPTRGGSGRRWWLGAAVATSLAGAGGVVIWQRGGSDEEPRVANAPPADATIEVDAAPPPPKTPAQVTLIVDSDPQGADVIQEHTGFHVGTTPFKRSIAPVEHGTVTYLVKLKGHEDARVELATDRDDKQSVMLKPIKAVGVKPPRTTPPPIKPPPIKPPPTEEPRVPTGPGTDGMLKPKL